MYPKEPYIHTKSRYPYGSLFYISLDAPLTYVNVLCAYRALLCGYRALWFISRRALEVRECVLHDVSTSCVLFVIWRDSFVTWRVHVTWLICVLNRLLTDFCVAVCCSVASMCRSALQCVAVCCSVLQCVEVCGSVLQCITVHYSAALTRLIAWILRDRYVCVASVLHCTAACCSAMQCAEVHCSVLQCIEMHYSWAVFAPCIPRT